MLHHDLPRAEKTLQLWHEDYPRDAEPLALLGRLEEAMLNSNGAEDAYRQAFMLEPDNDEYRLSFADALHVRLKTKEAVPIYQDYLRPASRADVVALRGVGTVRGDQRRLGNGPAIAAAGVAREIRRFCGPQSLWGSAPLDRRRLRYRRGGGSKKGPSSGPGARKSCICLWPGPEIVRTGGQKPNRYSHSWRNPGRTWSSWAISKSSCARSRKIWNCE